MNEKQSLEDQLKAAYKTNARLNRRCQRAEKMWHKYKRRFKTLQIVLDDRIKTIERHNKDQKRYLGYLWRMIVCFRNNKTFRALEDIYNRIFGNIE